MRVQLSEPPTTSLRLEEGTEGSDHIGPLQTNTQICKVETKRGIFEVEIATAAEQEAAYKAMKDAEQAASVRSSRSDKLKDSDWTQVIDAPVDQAAWATYRQALRDISAQAGFPQTVVWPTQPE